MITREVVEDIHKALRRAVPRFRATAVLIYVYSVLFADVTWNGRRWVIWPKRKWEEMLGKRSDLVDEAMEKLEREGFIVRIYFPPARIIAVSAITQEELYGNSSTDV